MITAVKNNPRERKKQWGEARRGTESAMLGDGGRGGSDRVARTAGTKGMPHGSMVRNFNVAMGQDVLAAKMNVLRRIFK